MSRKLPLVGTAASVARSSLAVTLLRVSGAARIAVIAASTTAEVAGFVACLKTAADRRALPITIDVSSSASLEPTCLLVVLGSDVPRATRHPEAHALWDRADLLLSTPSAIVAEALIHAL